MSAAFTIIIIPANAATTAASPEESTPVFCFSAYTVSSELRGRERCAGGNLCVAQGHFSEWQDGWCQCIISSHQGDKPSQSAAAVSEQTAATHSLALWWIIGNKKAKSDLLSSLRLPLLLSFHLSTSVFPTRNNWHSSASRGNELIYILPHKHTITLGVPTHYPKKPSPSSSSSFPRETSFRPRRQQLATNPQSTGKISEHFSHNSLLPRAFWDHSQQVAAPGGPIAHHGSLLLFTLKKKCLPDGLL